MSGQEIKHLLGEVCLKLVFRKAKCLTFRTSLPFNGWCFVTTNMDDLRWEDIHNLSQYTLYKLIDLRIAHAKYIGIHTPIVAYLIRATSTTQIRIASQSCQHVSRHIDFRDHGDMALLGISHNVASLFLGVETTMRCLIIEVGIGAKNGAGTL